MSLSSDWNVCSHRCSLSREVATLVPLCGERGPERTQLRVVPPAHQSHRQGGGVVGLFYPGLVLLETPSEGRLRP